MAQLRQDYSKFQASGAEVIVVGPEGQAEFEKYWRDHDLPFPGVPDPDHEVINRYGQEFKLLRFGRMPAQALIDTQGIVRYIHYGSSMEDIPRTEEILSLVADLRSAVLVEGVD